MAYLTLELQIYFSKTTAEERKKKKQKFDTNGRFTLKILVCFRQNNNFPAKDAGDQPRCQEIRKRDWERLAEQKISRWRTA